MNQPLPIVLILWGLWPLSSISQIGVADPVTGNATINFWGRVVDQDGNPLMGAKVNLTLNYGWIKSPTEGGMKEDKMSLETDENGNFALSNTQGHGIEVKAIDKAGYKLSEKVTRSYAYSWSADIFHPDPNKPVVFKMWKQRGAEQLVQPRSWNGQVACDGTTNRFDLLQGKRNAGGDLEIACFRNPLKLPPASNAPYDYGLQIAIIGGGIQTTEDEFTYLAPESGYSSSLTFGQKADDPKWVGKVKQEFYIKTADGHFGRLAIDWYAWQQFSTHLDWNCSINPSGSRNLER